MRPSRPNHMLIASGLLFAVFLWGGNNAGTKYIVAFWPPVWTGASRFLIAGLLLLLVIRLYEKNRAAAAPGLKVRLWLRGGLSLAIYITAFNLAVKHTAASHVALYLGASPVWALLWEGWPRRNLDSLRRYGAAILALCGVVVLFWDSLKAAGTGWLGESLGLCASVLWTNYGRQCKQLGTELSPARVTASTMWRAGVLLMPIACFELFARPLQWRWDIGAIQLYCIIAGGVVSFLIWNSALSHWRTSQVLLFNNLIPLSTTAWAAVCLGEKIGPRFWTSMALVLAGVAIGQASWARLVALRTVPPE